MIDRMSDEEREAIRNAYVESLFLQAAKRNKEAADTLSKIALGGASNRAKDLVRQLDGLDKFSREGRSFSADEPIRQEPQSRMKILAWAVKHPGEAIRVGVRQIFVAMEQAAPPHTSTFEEFPELPIDKAAEVMRLARTPRVVGGGVQKEDWPQSDQERMVNGLPPQGHPEHPNI